MKTFITIMFFCVASIPLFAKEFVLNSPSGNVQVTITIEDSIKYSIDFNGMRVLNPSFISMDFDMSSAIGVNPKLLSKKERSAKNILTPFYGISDNIEDEFNELALNFKRDFSLVFRAYDNGTAYQFQTRFKEGVKVLHEECNYNFTRDHQVYWPEADSSITSFESDYPKYALSDLANKAKAFSPILIELKDGKAMIMESDLLDYPGMFLAKNPNKQYGLKGKFMAYPKKEQHGTKKAYILHVIERESYLAKTKGKRSFPWRILALAKEDKELLTNTLVYQLATPAADVDWTWVKPGKVAWDWWSNINLAGVPFEAGMNTSTFKFFIDFAAEHQFEYVNIDAGWSDRFDLSIINPDMDMEEITNYAKRKSVGLFLWCAWHAVEKEWDKNFEQFEKWGIAGLKIDYMNRDDQKMVNFYERVIEEVADRKLLVNFHGAFKSTGLYRTYPNLINREGVLGLEHNKWSEKVTPEHDVTLPYIRMVAGPMDYTPGAIINRTKDNFSAIRNHPMSQGTRCHQLAMYVVYFAPLQMLSDAPTNYIPFKDILGFLSDVPTSWDETIPLAGEVGEYVIVARRKGEDWYVGGLTNWQSREVNIDLSFLGDGSYSADIFLDGPNAHRNAEDYVVQEQIISPSAELKLKMNEGGGFAMKLSPKN